MSSASEFASVARPYAQALLMVIKDQAQANVWDEALLQMHAIAQSPDLQTLLNHPKVSKAQLYDIFSSLMRTDVPAVLQNLLQLLLEKKRLQILPQIIEQFIELRDEYQGVAKAQVFSAFELSEQQLSELAQRLEKKLGRRLKLFVQLDPSLIGGTKIIVGDQVLDTSVRAQLESMEQALVH